MPRTTSQKEHIEKIRMNLWCRIFEMAKGNPSRRAAESEANNAVDAFDKKFNTKGEAENDKKTKD